MTIGICDDEPSELENLRGLIVDYSRQRHQPFEIHAFHGGEELLSALEQGKRFDVIFLDVYMGDCDGITAARKIREFDRTCCIIFATNSRDHALDGYGVRALQYLLKPIAPSDLASSLDLAMETLTKRKTEFIQIQNRQGSYRITLSDIVFAESKARVVTVHTYSHGDISFYDRLDNFELQCRAPRFLRCHKSYLVNLDYVHTVENDGVHLETGEEIRLSMSASEAKEIFASHIAKNI